MKIHYEKHFSTQMKFLNNTNVRMWILKNRKRKETTNNIIKKNKKNMIPKYRFADSDKDIFSVYLNQTNQKSFWMIHSFILIIIIIKLCLLDVCFVVVDKIFPVIFCHQQIFNFSLSLRKTFQNFFYYIQCVNFVNIDDHYN